MHWIKATAPNGRPNYINMAAVANILPGEDGGSIVFMAAIAATPDGKIRYLTTATTESPEELLAMGQYRPEWPEVKTKAAYEAARVLKNPKASMGDKVTAATAMTQANGRRQAPKARAAR